MPELPEVTLLRIKLRRASPTTQMFRGASRYRRIIFQNYRK